MPRSDRPTEIKWGQPGVGALAFTPAMDKEPKIVIDAAPLRDHEIERVAVVACVRGLHHEPGVEIIKRAMSHETCEIVLVTEDNRAARIWNPATQRGSLTALNALGVRHGATVRVRALGPGAEDIADEIVSVIEAALAG